MINTQIQNYTYNDTEAPIITILEPTNGQVYRGLNFNLVYTVQDYSTVNCSYILDSYPPINLLDCQSFYSIANLGDHRITLTATDKNNNIDSVSVNFKMNWTVADTNPPTIVRGSYGTYPSCLNQYNITLFYANWTDDVQLAGYIFSIFETHIGNNTSYNFNSSYRPFSGTKNISYYIFNLTGAPSSMVYWNFFANDTSGNWYKPSPYLDSFLVKYPSECTGGGPRPGDCPPSCSGDDINLGKP
jgi:hypothetical protein